MSLAEKYPLQWPESYPRTKWPKPSRFGNQSFAKCRDEIFKQLKLMLSYQERSTIVLSSDIPLRLDGIPYANYRQPEDKGVAVYFMYKNDPVVLCCDEWNKIEHNMWAIAKTIESIRAIERWGVSDFLKRSFTGFAALPPKTEKGWWTVLEFEAKPNSFDEVKTKYRNLAMKYHPDKGGNPALFQAINEAYNQALTAFS